MKKRIYLDYAASAPVAPEAERAMRPFFALEFGNPGSVHSFGQRAMRAVDESRQIFAEAMGAQFQEIYFMSSATEANNTVLRGRFAAWKKTHKSEKKPPRIIISSIEHESVHRVASDLMESGAEVVLLPVDAQGFVYEKALKDALNKRTILVSVIYGSNEVGTVQPIARLAELVRAYKKESGAEILFHTDAAQAFQYCETNVENLGVDAMTVSSQKMYGPKGCGILYLKNSAKNLIASIISGGSQEYEMRAGTENVPAIVGAGAAVRVLRAQKNKEAVRVEKLRNMLWEGIQTIVPDAELSGAPIENHTLQKDAIPFRRLPNNLHFYIPELEAQQMLIACDQIGIAISAGSACSVRAVRMSRVLKALGQSDEQARCGVRFTLGRGTTEKEIAETLKRLARIL